MDRTGERGIEIWYPGIRGAEALANILFGDVNPCAKLPVTFAKADADLPHPEIPGSRPPTPPRPRQRPLPGRPAPSGRWTGRRRKTCAVPFDIDYTEGLKVGYKWFDAEGKEPLFAFGHGLSYTAFAYSGLKAGIDSVSFTVRNTGKRAGAEIAQVYVGLPAAAQEPPKRLVAWEKIRLAPGESKTVTLPLEPEAPVCLQRTEGRVGTAAGRLQGVRGRFLARDPAHSKRQAPAVGLRAPFASEPLGGSLARLP